MAAFVGNVFDWFMVLNAGRYVPNIHNIYNINTDFVPYNYDPFANFIVQNMEVDQDMHIVLRERSKYFNLLQ